MDKQDQQSLNSTNSVTIEYNKSKGANFEYFRATFCQKKFEDL